MLLKAKKNSKISLPIQEHLQQKDPLFLLLNNLDYNSFQVSTVSFKIKDIVW
jgi:hypothetical protein